MSDKYPDDGINEVQITPLSTGDGGKPDPTVDSDPIRATLAGAQRIARSGPRRTPGRRRRSGADTSTRGGYSGAAPDETDPQAIGELLAGYVADRGWQRPLSQARVFSDWAAIVGDEVAAHCVPVGLREGELRIEAESTAWATQLRLLTATLLARLAAEVGPDVVARIHVSGPVGPSWKHGPRSVRGARGPRDTYG